MGHASSKSHSNKASMSKLTFNIWMVTTPPLCLENSTLDILWDNSFCILCKKSKSYVFWMTWRWENNDRNFSFGGTIPLNHSDMTKVCVFDIVLFVRVSPCLLFFSSVHPHFPLCARECFVYFRELGAQVTFRRRKQCGGIPGNFLPLVSLNTEVYIGQNQSGFCSFIFFLSLSHSLC